MQSIHDLGPIEGSLLSLERLQIAHGTETPLASESHHTLVFVRRRSRHARVDGERLQLGEAHAVVVTETESAAPYHRRSLLCARRSASQAAVISMRPSRANRGSRGSPARETKRRRAAGRFQVLAGPDNGSIRATLFVGYIPPGKAPWHYHLYDEIVYVLNGRGRVHLGDAGGSHDLHSRVPHFGYDRSRSTSSRTSAQRTISRILGVFSPAGSPSAAYLEPDTLAAYRVG